MENPLLPVDVLSRWVHVGTAIVIVGGSVFMRFVLMPAADQLPEAEHNDLRERVIGTWRKYVGIGIALFLLSGFYNYVRAIFGEKIPAGNEGLYHMLIGTKIILALVVFFLASALVGRSPVLEPLRQQRKKWLGLTILLAAIVVGLAGVAKVASGS